MAASSGSDDEAPPQPDTAPDTEGNTAANANPTLTKAWLGWMRGARRDTDAETDGTRSQMPPEKGSDDEEPAPARGKQSARSQRERRAAEVASPRMPSAASTPRAPKLPPTPPTAPVHIDYIPPSDELLDPMPPERREVRFH